ncbi:MAG: hypothetical protein IIY75_09205 [Erysipelotrichales bacterium]|nr:hypothetical protein [Erysipelotrichales bacterium]
MSEVYVREYKCPACGAELKYDGSSDSMTCAACGNSFSVENLHSYQAALNGLENSEIEDWGYTQTGAEMKDMKAYSCPSCGGEIVCESTTAATECPYCGNPAIIEKEVSGVYAPDGIIPFKKTKAEAVEALKKFYQGKTLLPKRFLTESRINNIQGVYVPFWLFDCEADADMVFDATKTRSWVMGDTEYVKTDHYKIVRSGSIGFSKIPVDGSTKMDDTYMESVEPFDYKGMRGFQDAYFSGYLANRYDVEPEDCLPRVNSRVRNSAQEAVRRTISGYSSVTPVRSHIDITNSRIRYVFMPVWILSTTWNRKVYTFMMNGQTGEVVGSLPEDKKKATLIWFAITLGTMLLGALGVNFFMGGLL